MDATGTDRGPGLGGKMAAWKPLAILGKVKSLVFGRWLFKARNQSLPMSRAGS